MVQIVQREELENGMFCAFQFSISITFTASLIRIRCFFWLEMTLPKVSRRSLFDATSLIICGWSLIIRPLRYDFRKDEFFKAGLSAEALIFLPSLILIVCIDFTFTNWYSVNLSKGYKLGCMKLAMAQIGNECRQPGEEKTRACLATPELYSALRLICTRR